MPHVCFAPFGKVVSFLSDCVSVVQAVRALIRTACSNRCQQEMKNRNTPAPEPQGEIHFCPARSTPEFYFVFKSAQKFLWL